MPSLLWVYPGSLVRDLHRASRLETAAELAKMGWEVTFVAAEVSSNELAEGVRAECIPRPQVYSAGYLLFHLALWRRITRGSGSVDVVLCGPESAPFLFPLPVLRRALRRSAPKLVVDWRTVVMNASYSTRGKIWNGFYWVAHHLANTFADGQTAITRRLAEAVGISDRQLLGVWPSGVRVEQFRAASQLRCWPAADQPVRLVYLGVLTAERNLLALCDAVHAVRADGLLVTLDLVGDGPQRSELQNYVAKLGDGGIAVRPPVERSLVHHVLSQSHVGVLPFPDEPQFRVSSPIKLFEYMAAGMPILATRIACHTDVLKGETEVFWAEDGSVAKLAAAVREVCLQKTELEARSRRMTQIAEAFTWEASAKLLDQALWRTMNVMPARGIKAAA